jgi:hypothetical protein
MKLNGYPQVTFSRHQNRIYIHGDMADKDIQAGEYIVYEAIVQINADSHSSAWNDMWLKEYVIALFKRQWGQNLIKFEGMQLPGGVTLNGRQMFDDALNEIQRLQEKIRTDFEVPPDFYVG